MNVTATESFQQNSIWERIIQLYYENIYVIKNDVHAR